MINNEHKDRVFKFIFGNPDNKEWTLSLYNAVNKSGHNNPDDIQLNTIEDAVYLGMKNDVSFIILDEINLWEHQSSYNPNMPMRFFIYAAKLYEKYILSSDYYQYSSMLQKAPKPRCICFYNGTAKQPEEKVLRLSEAFGGKADIEVCVAMLNINYGKNKDLMQTCQPLNEYAWLVDKIRSFKGDIEAAIDAAIADIPDNFLIKQFLLSHKAEVKGMFLTEYDQNRVLEQAVVDDRRRVAVDMLKDNYPLSAIIKISKLTEDAVLNIANSLNITIQ